MSDLASLIEASESAWISAIAERLGPSPTRSRRVGDALHRLAARVRDVSPIGSPASLEPSERVALHEVIVQALEARDVSLHVREWRMLSELRRGVQPSTNLRTNIATGRSEGRVALALRQAPEPSPLFELISRMATLAEARDEDELLAALARLATPALADICIVDLVVGNELRRAKVTHHDPTQVSHAMRLSASSDGSVCGRKELDVAMLGDSQVLTEADFPACPTSSVGALTELGVRTMMVVPLRVAAQTAGVVVFVTTDASGRRYGEADLALAEELVNRVAALVETKRLQEQTRARDEKIRLALEKSNVHLFEVDADLGKSWLTKPMGMPTKHVDSKMVQTITDAQRESLRTGERSRVEGAIVVNGEQRHWVVTNIPVPGPSGEPLGLIGTAVDVTEERRVQDQLSEALAFRDQVLGIIGHDLRNPLSSIVGIIGLARLNENLPPQAAENLLHVERATRRMLEMIGTLLDFSQARFTHALPITAAAMDLREVATSVVAELHNAHPERAIEVVANGDTSGSWDRARLAQVASNLLGNALAHGDSNAGITLALEDRGDVVELAVRNRGPVIAPETWATLFEPFRRGVPEGQGPRGLGLGLFIAQQIVRAHGGTLEGSSTEADGTTFTARLPR